MLYVHSFSAIEQQLCRLLSHNKDLTQIDIHSIHNNESIERLQNFGKHKILIYSFQQLDFYHHLQSFQHEVSRVKILLENIKKHDFEKLVLISYPGAYASSDNLFLQHKGIIEQLFVASDIPCTILRVQGICSAAWHINNFHHLFYNRSAHQYIIPKKSSSIIYSVNIKNLVEIIEKSYLHTLDEHYDVFDKITSLKTFLHHNSQDIKVSSKPSFYLYFQSYMSKYISPTMFELFMRAAVPMYNFRAEKAFNISLHADIFEQLKSANNHTVENDFIFSKRGQLIPVS